MNYINKVIMRGLLVSVCCCGSLWAAENDGMDVRVIGATFKTLAKGYVATADIERLKAGKIARIEKMKKEWFAAKYAEVYPLLSELPPRLKTKYGVTEGMTKTRAEEIIRGLDRKKMYEIIDNVPDRLVAEQFREQLRKDGQAGGTLQDKIGRIWSKAVAALGKGASPAR